MVIVSPSVAMMSVGYCPLLFHHSATCIFSLLCTELTSRSTEHIVSCLFLSALIAHICTVQQCDSVLSSCLATMVYTCYKFNVRVLVQMRWPSGFLGRSRREGGRGSLDMSEKSGACRHPLPPCTCAHALYEILLFLMSLCSPLFCCFVFMFS
jgi:hypothetical protein